MIHLKVTCDHRRTKKNGTHPIVFRITLNGKSRDMASGYSCFADDWDEFNCSIRPTNPKLAVVAKRLHDDELALLEKIRHYELKFPQNKSIQEVKEYLSAKNTNITVHEFWLQETLRMKQSKRFGNARNFESAMQGIQKHESLKVPFANIDFRWLTKLETKMRSSGIKTNSIGVYMRTLRSVFNSAINNDLTDANSYPFRRYKIKKESSTPRVASIKELKSFFDYKPNENHYTYNAWNYGMLIFLLRGINFADLAMLTAENLKNGRLIYHRQKTHKMYSVELLPLTVKILSVYASNDHKTLLPILTNDELMDLENLPARIMQKRKTCNKWLKKIGEELDIIEPLSTYVFRYSHANACKNLGYSKDLISESLGHGYGLAVSSAYLENYNIEMVDEMNKVVCSEVLKGK
ncbi:MAG: phage integrase SAM-like domain-containing protein [Bacteroidota bacterium]